MSGDSKPPVHRAWLLLLALPAFVAVWGGWVGLGELAGFGPVHLLPGIADGFVVNLAVTLPAGMEAYAVIGMAVWLSHRTASARTRRFARWSSIGALAIGSLGQIVYHVLARPEDGAPLAVTVFVSVLPVLVLGMGAALFHMIGEDQRGAEAPTEALSEPEPQGSAPAQPANTEDEQATADAALLAADGPPPWESLSKSAAVRRADELLPERSPRALRAALAQLGIDAPESSIRRVRSNKVVTA